MLGWVSSERRRKGSPTALDEAGHFAKAVFLAGDKEQAQTREIGAQSQVNPQREFLFRGLRAPGNEDEVVRRHGQQAAKLLRSWITAVGAGAIVLDRSGNVNTARRHPEPAQVRPRTPAFGRRIVRHRPAVGAPGGPSRWKRAKLRGLIRAFITATGTWPAPAAAQEIRPELDFQPAPRVWAALAAAPAAPPTRNRTASRRPPGRGSTCGPHRSRCR